MGGTARIGVSLVDLEREFWPALSLTREQRTNQVEEGLLR